MGEQTPQSEPAQVTEHSRGHRARVWMGKRLLIGALVTSPIWGTMGYMQHTDKVPGIEKTAPDTMPAKKIINEPVLVCAADVDNCTTDTALGYEVAGAHEPVDPTTLHAYTLQAFIDAENAYFMTENGVSGKGQFSATGWNILGGLKGNATLLANHKKPSFGAFFLRGASTIDMQVVSKLYLNEPTDPTSLEKVTEKIDEMRLAVTLNKTLPGTKNEVKLQILGDYINSIYYGRGAYGIQAAAQAYFGVEAKDLSIGQSYIISRLPNAPGDMEMTPDSEARLKANGTPNRGKNSLSLGYDHTHNESLKYRHLTAEQDAELNDYKSKYIITSSSGKLLSFKSPFIDYKALPTSNFDRAKAIGASKFVDATLVNTANILHTTPADLPVTYPGLKIYTSLREKDQAALYSAVQNNSYLQADDKIGFAAMARDKDGGVVAVVSGKKDSRSGINLAINSQRFFGSSFKGLIDAEAAERGQSQSQVFTIPEKYTVKLKGRDDWHLTEGSGCSHKGESAPCEMTSEEAVAYSSNPWVGMMANKYGYRTFTDMMVKIGLPIDPNNPTALLGQDKFNVSVVSGAFGVLANAGQTIDPHSIIKMTTPNNKKLYSYQEIKASDIFKKKNNKIALEAMQKVINGGTATGKFDPINGIDSVAVKTGTAGAESAANDTSSAVSDVAISGVSCIGESNADNQPEMRTFSAWAGHVNDNKRIRGHFTTGASLGPIMNDYLNAVQSGNNCNVAELAKRSTTR